MSFIDKFLDLTAPLPQQINRNLKLLKVAENRSKERKKTLQEKRVKFLAKLKENKENKKELEQLYTEIEKTENETSALSDYKINIIRNIQNILSDTFLKNLKPIINEGAKECEEQKNNPNNFPYMENSFNTGIGEKTNLDSPSSDYSKKKKDGGNTKHFLGNKKNRKSLKSKKLLNTEYEDMSGGLHGTEQGSNDVFCKCHQPSYGDMIQCENPECKGKWFHYACVGIDNEKLQLNKEWYCSEECKLNAKKIKEKNCKKKKKFN